MASATEFKPKEIGITAETLRYIAGLNGYTVTELAAKMDCSDTLLYQACRAPDVYPGRYAELCKILPRREP